jgi:hypothetical protein
MMNDVIADLDPEPTSEKIDPPPNVAKERHQAIPISPLPPVLTSEDVPSHNWLARVGFATVVLLVLGWTGIHFNFGERIWDSWNDVTAVVKSHIAPPPTPASFTPAASDISHDSLVGADSAGPTENKNPDAPLQGATDTSSSSRGTN